jgi:hypothetical protein
MAGSPRTFAVDELLFREGDERTFFAVILRGNVTIEHGLEGTRLEPLLKDKPALYAALVDVFLRKGEEFAPHVKMGRTQLQDAVPMTLGQEFAAFAHTIQEDIDRLGETWAGYTALVCEKLSQISGLRAADRSGRNQPAAHATRLEHHAGKANPVIPEV